MEMINKYRKKPVVIEAIRFNGENRELIANWLGAEISSGRIRDCIFEDLIQIETLEGVMTANVGDWIVKGVKGEFYPVKDDIFRETYDLEA